MHDDAHFNDLERYLQSAAILDIATFSTTTAHHSYRVTFEGGAAAMVKPEDHVGDGSLMIGREAAAWTLARELGSHDLVSTTRS
jgi:hypothetical protein